MKRIGWVAVSVLLTALAGGLPANEPSDPWAPGASSEPWPLIERLQRWDGRSEPEPDWAAIVRHEDKLVRAAAAAALGRVADPPRRTLLDSLLVDRGALVRETAVWAALQYEGEPTAALIAMLMDDPGPPHTLLSRFVPQEILYMSRSDRRAWVRGRMEGPLPRPTLEGSWNAAVERIHATSARCEYDADELVELTARIVSGPAHQAGTFKLQARLVPHDPWLPPSTPRTRASSSSEPRGEPVSLRAVGGDGTDSLPLPPASDRQVQIAFHLEDLPPDVYTLTLGNPLFFRVRRSRAAEALGESAARDVLKTDEALATVSRLRMLAAAPALRERFAASLTRYGFGFNAWRDVLALARLADAHAAELVLPPLLAARGFLDPWTSSPPDLGHLLTVGFGGTARTRLAAVVSRWRELLDAGFGEPLEQLLRDRSYGPGSAVDVARLDVLAELGPLLGEEGYKQYKKHELASAALAGAAVDHPQEVASVLAKLTSQPGELFKQLQGAVSPLRAPEAERLFGALWAALPPPEGKTDDLRARLAAEAERLGVSTPTPTPAAATAGEVERQLFWVLQSPSSTRQVELALTQARALLARESAPLVALMAAEAEMTRGRVDDAARLIPRPEALPTRTPASGPTPVQRAHSLRGRVAAARGDLAEAARELAAVGALSDSSYDALTKPIAHRIARIGANSGASVRFLPRSAASALSWSGPRASWRGALFAVNGSGDIHRFDFRTGLSQVIGRTPGPVRELEAVSGDTVVAAGVDAVWRIDAGRTGVTWTVPRASPTAATPTLLKAGPEVTVVRDSGGGLRAWSTATPTRDMWQLQGVVRVALVPEQSGVLVVQQGNDRAEYSDLGPPRCFNCSVIRHMDARTGKQRWTWALSFFGQPPVWSVGSGRVFVWTEPDTLAAYSAADGRRLWTHDKHEPGRRLGANNLVDFVASADGQRVYVRVRSTLEGLSAVDGRTLWTLPFATNAQEAMGRFMGDQKLVPTPDGSVWWLGQLESPSVARVARLVSADGKVVRSPPPSEGSDLTVLSDGTLLMPGRYGQVLEVWEPR